MNIQSYSNPMESGYVQGLFGLMNVLVFFNILIALFSVVSIIGGGISLYHSLKEDEKRTIFIVFSSIALCSGVVGLFVNFFGVVAYVFAILSIKFDNMILEKSEDMYYTYSFLYG